MATKEFDQVRSLYFQINGPMRPATFLTGLRSTDALGTLGFTAGDKILLKLYLCEASGVLNTAHTLRRANGPIVFALFSAVGSETLLAQLTEWTLVADDTGEHYEGIIDLNTVPIGDLTWGTTASKEVWLDLEFQSPGNQERLTFSRTWTLYRQTYKGTEPPVPIDPEQPYPPAADIPSRQELQALLLQMQQLQTGSFSWYNADQGNWWLVRLSGAEGAEAITWDGPYDTPDEVPVSDPYELTVGYSVSISGGVGEAHTMELAEWVPVNSVFSVEGHGRLKITDVQPLGTAGSAPTRLMFDTLPGWTGGDIEVGAKLRLLYVAGEQGPQGAKGDKGDTGDTGAPNTLTVGTVTTLPAGSSATATITGAAPAQVLSLGLPQGPQGIPGEVDAEARLAALEAVRRPLGGVEVGFASSSGTGNGLLLARSGPTTGQRTILFEVTLAETNLNGGLLASAEVGTSDAWILRSGAGEVSLSLVKSGSSPAYLRLRPPLSAGLSQVALHLDGDAMRVRCDVNGEIGDWVANTNPTKTGWGALRYLASLWGGYGGGFSLVVSRVAEFNYTLDPAAVADYFRYGVAAGDRGASSLSASADTSALGGWTKVNCTGAVEDGFLRLTKTSAGGVSAGMLSTGFGGAPAKKLTQARMTVVARNPSTTETIRAQCSAFGATTPSFVFELAPEEVRTIVTDFSRGTTAAYGTSFSLLSSTAPLGMQPSSDGTATAHPGPQGMQLDVSAAHLAGIGCVLDLTPDSVSPSGRWSDMSGSANDAIPGANTLITPLSPRPQSRTLPVTWTSTSIPANSEGSVLLTASHHAAIAAVRLNDPVTWAGASALPAGLVVKETRCTSAGNVTLTVVNATGAAISTGAVTGTLLHTIP